MSIPGQRQYGQPHPPIDIISDRRRLARSLTLGPVMKGTSRVQAPMASNSSTKAATQLAVFLKLCWNNKDTDTVVTVNFENVDQNAEYVMTEAPDKNLSGMHPVRMTVTRGLAGPSTMTDEGHFVLILSDVELTLVMKYTEHGLEKPIKISARHFTVRADGVIEVHT